MNKNKHILHGLTNDDYEHPFDKKALDALENTPGLKAVGSFFTKHAIERFFTVMHTGSNIKVTSENYPGTYEYLQYACEVLDVKMPDLYIQWGYDINACTVGSEHPIVVLNSGLIDLCDDDEILFIIGHELGHIKSNHMLYHMMAQAINGIIDSIPGGGLVAAPVQYALYYWDRMSEFTADRAGLLCCQNAKAAVRSFIKMAGLPKKEYSNINTQSFIKQSEEFEDLDCEGFLNKAMKVMTIANQTHPWSVMRVAQLREWAGSGAARSIINKQVPLIP